MEPLLQDVKIRMYRQGLGDCFLITFNFDEENEPRHLLIDFGVLGNSKNDVAKMKTIASDILKTTGGKIAVLAATHEHWDHVSGFIQAADIFDEILVDEIWMAWTEDQADPDAIALKESHNRKLDTVRMAYQSLKKNNAITGPQHIAFNSFFSLFGLDEGKDLESRKQSRTSQAFQNLKKRPNSKKTYCHPGKVLTRDNKLPGVRFYILGPPKDRKMLKKMNPSTRNSEIYTNLANSVFGDNIYYALAAENDGVQDNFTPFGWRAGISLETIDQYKSDNKTYLWAVDVFEEYSEKRNEWRKIETDWLNLAGRLAIHLDNGINNTSLAIAIELVHSGKVLLFPADAQIGNWLSWKIHSWDIRDKQSQRQVTINDLLANTVFYKVGHHGSHNATLKDDGLEKMISEDLIAMIPVDKKAALKKGWKMPYKKLHEKLLDKTHSNVILADENNNNTGVTTELYHEVSIKN